MSVHYLLVAADTEQRSKAISLLRFGALATAYVALIHRCIKTGLHTTSSSKPMANVVHTNYRQGQEHVQGHKYTSNFDYTVGSEA